MNEQEEFFSPSHSRLLNIAIWAKYLAWVVLVVYILYTIGVYIQEQSRQFFSGTVPTRYSDFPRLLVENPRYAFGLLVEIVSIFLKGIVYFLVLKGISLGLNMIVETDINYREQGEARNEE